MTLEKKKKAIADKYTKFKGDQGYYKKRFYYALVKSVGILHDSTFNKDALKEALLQDDYLLLLHFLQHGIKPNKKVDEIPLLLHAKNKWMAQLLITWGADVHAKNLQDGSLLHHAVYMSKYHYNNYSQLFNYFVKRGVSVQGVDFLGDTVLHTTVIWQRKAIPLVLASGVPLNVRNKANQTADDLLVPIRSTNSKRLLKRTNSSIESLVKDENRRRQKNRTANWRRFLKCWLEARDVVDARNPMYIVLQRMPGEIMKKIQEYVMMSPDMIPAYYFPKKK